MPRIYINKAQPGMVLLEDVIDSHGSLALKAEEDDSGTSVCLQGRAEASLTLSLILLQILQCPISWL